MSSTIFRNATASFSGPGWAGPTANPGLTETQKTQDAALILATAYRMAPRTAPPVQKRALTPAERAEYQRAANEILVLATNGRALKDAAMVTRAQERLAAFTLKWQISPTVPTFDAPTSAPTPTTTRAALRDLSLKVEALIQRHASPAPASQIAPQRIEKRTPDDWRERERAQWRAKYFPTR